MLQQQQSVTPSKLSQADTAMEVNRASSHRLGYCAVESIKKTGQTEDINKPAQSNAGAAAIMLLYAVGYCCATVAP